MAAEKVTVMPVPTWVFVCLLIGVAILVAIAAYDSYTDARERKQRNTAESITSAMAEDLMKAAGEYENVRRGKVS